MIIRATPFIKVISTVKVAFEGNQMKQKLFIEYEALAYNLPECGSFEFLDHTFVANRVTQEIAHKITSDNDMLKANILFKNCCLPYHDGHLSYVTAKNKAILEVEVEINKESDLHNLVEKMVKEKMDAMEEHLIFITNVHIFFPIVKINIRSDDNVLFREYGYYNVRPMPFRKWTHVTEGIDLMRRLHFHIDKEAFDRFRFHKNHTRYNRAFNYYIRAFHQYDHASSFCLLCSALDAITGCSDATDTKERLAKYSSILFCNPLQMEQQKEKMRYFYKIRSTFVHGKGCEIKLQDEIELREYVRKFLIAYFLFWQEMNIKNEPQMLQKLDQINADPSLYIKYAPGAYGFIRLSEEHEKRAEGVVHMDMDEKKEMLMDKMQEALTAKERLPLVQNGKN